MISLLLLVQLQMLKLRKMGVLGNADSERFGFGKEEGLCPDAYVIPWV